MNKFAQILEEISAVVNERKEKLPEGSYTTYLFNSGQDKILKKVGEESAEVIIASKNNANAEILYETADLIYHLTVMLSYHNISWEEVAEELKKRR